ncbi:type I restriction-modification system subunit M N-terminal domain-containing protein [Rhodoferax sp.]|uniref:type I restriction-modification system subunit M N-terminal domain-containing protein n=1 Tax=Rhodoferax sp. TaxID=50421 RepID=UPI002727CF9A|nr:type I restriction-modification system subunit M N-terminal domain-containing protein [Rhodoferax sp.]MDO9198912.1 type I restriction-modification system subunit M N-terminal domain-containing protein [Rhodoferax sp.]
MNSATIVQKLWNCCNVLRDDGMSYGDYVEQPTYLLFLKMVEERSKPPFNLTGEAPSPTGRNRPGDRGRSRSRAGALQADCRGLVGRRCRVVQQCQT